MSSRPGGRTARTTAAVVRATLNELAEHGYQGLTVDAVASRAGVHRATVYRRWGSAEVLVAEALLASRDVYWEPALTGSLVDDLMLLGREVRDHFTPSGLRSPSAAAIAAAFQSARVAAALHEFFVNRHRRAAGIVEAALTRGDIPAGTDPDAVVQAAVAPLYYRLFVSRSPVTDADIAVAARAAVVAAERGVFIQKAQESS